jgi:hypothetical protein
MFCPRRAARTRPEQGYRFGSVLLWWGCRVGVRDAGPTKVSSLSETRFGLLSETMGSLEHDRQAVLLTARPETEGFRRAFKLFLGLALFG